ncbi:MAG: polymerase, sigma-24 subunit, subfamily [Acidobacteria bacterium]|nr:polymerase, sigma-24 subunit, subfamily [Acidobacteriota bacterium]
MDDAELDLVRRARGGDTEAFRAIVEAHSRPLFRAAWRILGDAEGAEDAVQEAFLRAWRALASFDEEAELSTWLYRIAVNAAIDQRRGRRRRQAIAAPLALDLDGAVVAHSAEPDPHRRAVSGEIARRTRAALERLPDAERTALLLRHFEGRSIAEIARALGRGENAAKQTVFRAVRKLRAALGPLTETSHVEPA